jgi:tripartite-type tricarboxylate transporter receptor subunit TctC
MIKHTSKACLAVMAGLAVTLSAQAQSWPDKPIRVIVPYPPGGPSDIVLRIAAANMQPVLKQPIVLENRPGAGGNLGASEASRAAPDGYTWFWSTDSVFTVNPHVYQNLGFKQSDLVPVTIASSFSQTLVCNPNAGVKTLTDLVNKAKTETLNYASGGAGVPGHLAMELLLSQAKISMQHIPYKGPAPAAQDVIGGQVPCGFLAGPTVLPFIRSGRLVALAVSGSQRSPVLPEVPTVAEAGFPGYDATFLLALFAPKGTPAAMQKALVDALKSPEVIEKLKQTDQNVVGSTSAKAVEMLDATSKKWGAVAQRIGLRLD